MKAVTIESRVTKLEDYVFGEPDVHAPTGLLPRTARIEWKIDHLTLQVKDQRKILNQHTATLEDHTDRLKTIQTDMDSMRVGMDSMNVRLTNVESGVAEILRRLPEPTV